MAITKSKALMTGATGYIGKNVCKASVNQGHPTFILVRSLISADPAKAELIKSFQESGVTVLKVLYIPAAEWYWQSTYLSWNVGQSASNLASRPTELQILSYPSERTYTEKKHRTHLLTP